MKRIPLLCCALLCQFLTWAQLEAPFDQLNVAEFSSGLFWPIAQFSVTPPDGTETTTLSRSLQRQYLFAFQQADFTETILQEQFEIDQISRAMKLNDTSIPITLVDVQYEDFVTNAFIDGLIEIDNDGYVDVSGTASPYETKSAFFAQIDLTDHTGETYLFTLPEQLYFTNHEVELENIEIDPDDGFGFRPFTPGTVIEVDYNEDVSDKFIRIRGSRAGNELMSTLLLKSAGGATTFPDPDLPPWPVETAMFPWKFSSEWNGEAVYGNAYTLMSEDGIFDKPFIFVEGIDFGLNAQVLRNGDFGWYEFTSGVATNYPFLQNMPILLNSLRDLGYDLVLLDFFDGATDIERNSELLISLINKVNNFKIGQEELKIAGASMGGQICRVALKQMEDQGIPHCTSHNISLDSPHEGANLPYSLQAAVYFASSFNASAQDFVNYFLKRPATRQLLISQFNADLSRHEAYMDYIHNLGYPAYTRNIGIANGSGAGNLLGINSGAPFLDYECSFAGDQIFKMRILAAPGDAYHDQATATSNVIFEGDYSSIIDCDNNIACVFGGLVSNGGYHAVLTAPNTLYNLDNAPGGTRNSLKQFVDQINPELGVVNDYWLLNCDEHIDPWEYQAAHSFIPTVSALGIETDEYNLNVEGYLQAYPEACPFDLWLTHSTNTQHSEITETVIALMLEELEYESPLQVNELTGLSENGGQFNMGSPLFKVIPELTISNGGTLSLNDNSPLHFAEDPNAFTENPSLFQARTKGCGTLLNIEDGGTLAIGDEETNRTAELTIMNGTEFYLKTGGTLTVHAESTLILKGGSTLYIDGGLVDLKANSSLIIEEGAQLVYLSESYFKMDEGTQIDLHGEIHVHPDVEAEIRMVGTSNGTINCYNPGLSIHGSASSTISISGTDLTSNLIVVKENGALRTNWELGNFWFSEGKFIFENNSELTSNAYLKATEINFYAETSDSQLWLSNGAKFQDCTLESIHVLGTFGLDLLRVVDSKLTHTDFQLFGGGYRFFGSEFINSTIYSEALGLTAHVLESTFTGNSFNDAINDYSDVTLYFRDSSIENYDVGIVKTGGELRMKCSSIFACNIAVEADVYTEVNLSTDLGGGYNEFWQNETHFFLTGVASFELENGYNRFGNTPYHLFEGSILGVCNEACQQKLNVSNNLWPNGGLPLNSDYNLEMVDVVCDFNTPLEPFDGCTVKLIDKSPIAVVTCGESDPIKPGKVETVKSALQPDVYPLIFTEHFDGVTILEALHTGMSFMSYYGEVPDEHHACTLLDELIQADHDLSNELVRRVKNAARKNLLISSTVLLERGEIDFDPLLSAAYNAELALVKSSLNKLTLSNFVLDDYQEQFKNELDKARFSHAIGRFEDALLVLNVTDECGLDFIEQIAINERISREVSYVARLDFAELYYGLDTVFTDPAEFPFELPSPWLPLDAQFGVQLTAPGYFVVPLCDGNMVKSAASSNQLNLQPNPAKDHVYLNSDDLIGHTIVRVFDLGGRCCLERQYVLTEGELLDVNIGSLAPGVYLVTADDGVHRGYERMVVR